MTDQQQIGGERGAQATPEEPSVFISYRRLDSGGSAGRLHGDLEDHLGEGRVFRDRDMRPGTNWVKRLQTLAGSCHVMLVVIGPRWATLAEEGSPTPRIFDPADTLRIEVETALARDDVTIIPVLVDDARMPLPAELPESLAELCELHAFTMYDSHWGYDLERLIGELRAALGVTEPEPKPDKPDPTPRQARWALIAGAAGAAILAAPLSAALANKPYALGAWSISDLAEARERIVYYALERGVFWALVGACITVAWSLLARSERTPLASGIAGLSAGAIGGVLGGLAFQGVKYLGHADVGVLDTRPDEWLLRLPNVAIPAAFIGWAFAGGTRRLGWLGGALAGFACGLAAVAVESPAHGRWVKLVIEAAAVTVPLVLLATRQGSARVNRPLDVAARY